MAVNLQSNIDKTTSLHKNNELQLLCFRLEDNRDIYAVNVFKIREVVKFAGKVIKTNHGGNDLVDGLITIRDTTLPLIDMRKWFYFDSRFSKKDLSNFGVSKNDKDENIIMICEFSKFTIGVKIYEADRILSKKWTEIEQSAGFGGDPQNGKLVSRTKYFDGRLVQVVDIEKMLVDVFPWIETERIKELDSVKKVASTKSILIADDSPSVIKTMQIILNKLEVPHNDFINGQKLLDYLASPSTDIDSIGMIITDLEMPEASGFEVINQVKKDPKLSHIPVVVNSSMSGTSNETMAISLNANGFISKSNPLEIEIGRAHV